ncbi:hypothetical protein AB6A40_005901 [Gnathostoma spinigerum]|uniref:Transmembrane protein n=1 Tax=Gnathostoma spinigerum TaxID=75299 RepID=A0ABD6ERL1_9BILA
MTIFGHGSATKKEKLTPPNSNPPGASKPTALVDGVTAPPRGFGIRSYLHQFYQSPTLEDIESSGAWYLLPPPPAQRTGLYICRVLTVIGLLLLIAGAGAIVVGYTWPHEGVEESIVKIAIYQDEDGSFYVPPDKFAEILQDPMKHWKVAGLCVFATGAAILALGLLVPTCAQCFRNKHLAGFVSEDGTPNEPPIRIYPAGGVGTRVEQTSSVAASRSAKTTPKISPTSGPVPVMEEISKVQPNEGQTKESDEKVAVDLLLGDADTR